MADIRGPRLLYIKGALFLVVGIAASTILLLEDPSLRTAALLAIAVWAFARAYYDSGNEDRHEPDTSTKRQRVDSARRPSIHSLALRACMRPSSLPG